MRTRFKATAAAERAQALASKPALTAADEEAAKKAAKAVEDVATEAIEAARTTAWKEDLRRAF